MRARNGKLRKLKRFEHLQRMLKVFPIVRLPAENPDVPVSTPFHEVELVPLQSILTTVLFRRANKRPQHLFGRVIPARTEHRDSSWAIKVGKVNVYRSLGEFVRHVCNISAVHIVDSY